MAFGDFIEREMERKHSFWAAGAALLSIAAALAGASAQAAPRITEWDLGPTIEGEGWKLELGGRAQLDYTYLDAARAGADWSEREIRRLRLSASAEIGDNLSFKFEGDRGPDGAFTLTEGYVQWAPTGGQWNIRAGHAKPQNSLDELTSSRYISTLERAAFTDALAFTHQLGIAVNATGDRFLLSAGVYGENVHAPTPLKGLMLAGRAALNPVKTDATVAHLGASFRYRQAGAGDPNIRIRQRPYSHIPGRIISTGRIGRSDTFIGAEAGAIHGRFWAAAEYGVDIMDCAATASCDGDPTFQGGYGEFGVFFGGRKTYKGGKFDRPKIDRPVTQGGPGAFSLVARFDSLDLSNGGVDGGALDAYILGADWWPTKHTRFGVNYFHIDADIGASTSGLDPEFAALVTANIRKEKANGVLLRAQLAF
ncbi:MAG: hypothetical protein Tsb0010_08000 [Parvularculaceae bacterium]